MMQSNQRNHAAASLALTALLWTVAQSQVIPPIVPTSRMMGSVGRNARDEMDSLGGQGPAAALLERQRNEDGHQHEDTSVGTMSVLRGNKGLAYGGDDSRRVLEDSTFMMGTGQIAAWLGVIASSLALIWGMSTFASELENEDNDEDNTLTTANNPLQNVWQDCSSVARSDGIYVALMDCALNSTIVCLNDRNTNDIAMELVQGRDVSMMVHVPNSFQDGDIDGVKFEWDGKHDVVDRTAGKGGEYWFPYGQVENKCNPEDTLQTLDSDKKLEFQAGVMKGGSRKKKVEVDVKLTTAT